MHDNTYSQSTPHLPKRDEIYKTHNSGHLHTSVMKLASDTQLGTHISMHCPHFTPLPPQWRRPILLAEWGWGGWPTKSVGWWLHIMCRIRATVRQKCECVGQSTPSMEPKKIFFSAGPSFCALRCPATRGLALKKDGGARLHSPPPPPKRHTQPAFPATSWCLLTRSDPVACAVLALLCFGFRFGAAPSTSPVG